MAPSRLIAALAIAAAAAAASLAAPASAAESIAAPIAAPAATPSATPGDAPAPEAASSAPAPPPAAPAIPAATTWLPRLLIQSDAVLAHHGPDAPAIEDAVTRPGFYLRRARIGTDVAAGVWRARLMFEAAAEPEIATAIPIAGVAGAAAGTPTAGAAAPRLDPIAGEIAARAPRPTEAFVALRPHKAFAVAVGSLRVPIGLSRQIDEGDLRLPERARVVVRATPDFRAGVAAGGDLGLLQYVLGSFAAAPTFGAGFASGGVLYVVRLSGEPVGPVGLTPQLRQRPDPWYGWWRFAIGLSGFLAQLPGANEFGLGGDGQFQWQRLCVTGELLWTRRADVDRIGFTVEPGVFLIPDRLELVARVEWLNDEVGPRSPADAWGAAIGATLFSPMRQVRLQAAYTLRHPSAGTDRFSGWAVLRATFTL